MKKIFAIFFLFVFFSAPFIVCAAANNTGLEVPFLGLTKDTSLPQYVATIFQYAISIAGAIAVISFVVGAVGLIISGDNEEARSNAKDRMKGAVLGLLLTMTSYLILDTINIALTQNLTITGVPIAPKPPITMSPGVYYCLGVCNGGGCVGISQPLTSDNPTIPQPFYRSINSVVIVDDQGSDLNYGVIFHSGKLTDGGQCTLPIIGAGCHPVGVAASSANIFLLNDMSPGRSGDGVTFYSEPFGLDRGAKAGYFDLPDNEIYSPSTQEKGADMCFNYDGVTEPDWYKYKCSGSKCGHGSYTCKNDSDCDTNNGEYCDNGVCLGANGEQNCSANACETFQDCPGSVEITGTYLVAFYSALPGSSSSNAKYCQTFTDNVDDLNSEPFLASGGKKLDDIYIIPTQ